MAANLSYRTSIRTDEAGTHIRYHSTDVVTFTADTITLRTGGYATRTTKSKMNKAAQVYGLGFQVWQSHFDWFVSYQGRTIKFEDRELVLSRVALPMVQAPSLELAGA